MEPENWARVAVETIAAGVERQVIWGERGTLSRFRFGSGVHVARHSHPSEQFTCVLDGAMRMELEGRKIHLRAGDVLVIPPDAAHEVWFLEDSIVVDFFSPPRDDWKEGRSHYLAGKASPEPKSR